MCNRIFQNFHFSVEKFERKTVSINLQSTIFYIVKHILLLITAAIKKFITFFPLIFLSISPN